MKHLCVLLLVMSCLISFSVPTSGQVIMVLYHAHSNMNFTAAMFTEHMDFLKENGYHTITVDQFNQWYFNAVPLPPRPIMLSFDDNYIQVYDVAYPILETRGQCAVNFAHTNFVGVVSGSGDHCDWMEIQEMEDAGVFFTESHTRTHINLTTCNDATAWDEINGSRLAIESNMTSKTCTIIAYPYGAYDSRAITYCQIAGYFLAFTTIDGYNYRTTPPFEMRRTGCDGVTLATFKTRIRFQDLPPAPPGEGWTIDNNDPNCFIDSGDWTVSTATGGYYATDYLVAPAGDGSACVRWGTWLPDEGVWRLYAWWSADSNHASNATYQVHHSGSESITPIQVDQRINGGQWNLLGEFYFSQESPATVILSDNADGYVVADGIWFEPVSKTNIHGIVFF